MSRMTIDHLFNVFLFCYVTVTVVNNYNSIELFVLSFFMSIVSFLKKTITRGNGKVSVSRTTTEWSGVLYTLDHCSLDIIPLVQNGPSV